MLEKLQSYWLYGATYSGIEVYNDAGQTKVAIVTAIKTQSTYSNIQEFQFNTWEDFDAEKAQVSHAQLVINTKDVLIKRVEGSQDEKSVLARAFPSLPHEDFYYEIYSCQNHSFIAICKKELVENFKQKFIALGISLVGVHLGFGIIKNLLPFLKMKTLFTANHVLEIHDNSIQAFEHSYLAEDSHYLIEDVKVSNKNILALSALSAYNSQNRVLGNTVPTNELLLSDLQSKKFFKNGLWLAIGFFLVVLLINFFVFNARFNRVQELRKTLSLSQQNTAKVELLTQAVSNKEKVAQSILNASNSKASFYIDRIVSSRPTKMRFTSIAYQPLKKSIQADQAVTFRKHEIIVSGNNRDKTQFSRWLETLENYTWVEQLRILSYSDTNSESSFSINILLNDSEN